MDGDILLETRGITKSFPGVLANDKISFDIRKGEVHALLGENGAGKTTLMSILFGLYQPQEGEVRFDGRAVRIDSPKAALRLGIGMIHQHFMLIPNLTVLENVILGLPSARPPLLELGKARAGVRELFDRYNFDIDLDAYIRDLSVGAQQRVEIVKALYRRARLLILDEPTAVLTPQESEELFGVLRGLREQGASIIFISHKIEEVLEISDRVTVLRDGRVVGTVQTAATTREELARLMVGREVITSLPKAPAEPGPVVLEMTGVTLQGGTRSALHEVSLTVRAGEILGVAGVDGNGQDELGEVIAGLRRGYSGETRVFGKDIAGMSAKGLIEAGLGHIPADRRRQGLVMEFDVGENMILHAHDRPPLARHGLLALAKIREYAQGLIDAYSIKAPGSGTPIRHLSGGNQQKVVLARELDRRPRLLLILQPTRGLDIGAREYVHRQLLEQRGKGAAIVLISTDLEEVRSLSDRLAVIYEGRIVGELDPRTAGVEKIGLMMAGVVDRPV
ncbi:MAG TPA: ABC transporter ATP-binding protein [Bacillota bacterium]